MRITLETAEYLAAVMRVLDGPDPAPLPTSGHCPECDGDPDIFDDQHVVALVRDRTVVVLGCEGYACINPALVGLDRPCWEPAPPSRPPVPPGPWVALEAICGLCDEVFNPADVNDTIHLVRADGTECGGRGKIVGAWR